MSLEGIGRGLVALGLLVTLLGVALLLVSRVPGVGRLPGDIILQRGGITVYIPLVTCLLGSIILTVVLNILARILGR